MHSNAMTQPAHGLWSWPFSRLPPGNYSINIIIEDHTRNKWWTFQIISKVNANYPNLHAIIDGWPCSSSTNTIWFIHRYAMHPSPRFNTVYALGPLPFIQLSNAFSYILKRIVFNFLLPIDEQTLFHFALTLWSQRSEFMSAFAIWHKFIRTTYGGIK